MWIAIAHFFLSPCKCNFYKSMNLGQLNKSIQTATSLQTLYRLELSLRHSSSAFGWLRIWWSENCGKKSLSNKRSFCFRVRDCFKVVLRIILQTGIKWREIGNECIIIRGCPKDFTRSKSTTDIKMFEWNAETLIIILIEDFLPSVESAKFCSFNFFSWLCAAR